MLNRQLCQSPGTIFIAVSQLQAQSWEATLYFKVGSSSSSQHFGASYPSAAGCQMPAAYNIITCSWLATIIRYKYAVPVGKWVKKLWFKMCCYFQRGMPICVNAFGMHLYTTVCLLEAYRIYLLLSLVSLVVNRDYIPNCYPIQKFHRVTVQLCTVITLVVY